MFYRRSGFRLCGPDGTLYDPELDPTTGRDEVPLFFTRPLSARWTHVRLT